MPARPRPARRIGARLRSVVQADAAGIRQGLVALMLSSVGDLAAGLTLGAITHTLDTLPGLLVLVPAAIGLRGNIFGSFGNRLSTSIHAGTFRLSGRRETVLGQNILASMVLTAGASLLLALAGWLIPIVTVVLIQSTAVRMTVSILGIAMTLVGILVVLNKAHLKQAIWKV